MRQGSVKVRGELLGQYQALDVRIADAHQRIVHDHLGARVAQQRGQHEARRVPRPGGIRSIGSTEHGGAASLDVVLPASRVRDTLTLWHLLSRVDAGDRERVLARMLQLTELPAGIEREKVLQLDRDTLTRWREELAWKW